MKKVIISMATIITIAVVASISYWAVTTALSPKQEVYQSDYGIFSITAPANLTEQILPVDVPTVGRIDAHAFTGQNGNVVYSVTYSDYPAGYIGQTNPEELLNGARDGAVGKVDRKIIGEETVSLDGNPGKEITVYGKMEEGNYFISKMRLYLVGNRLYVVMILAPEGELSVKEMDDYLNSFSLKK
jgi:hypothetical protein